MFDLRTPACRRPVLLCVALLATATSAVADEASPHPAYAALSISADDADNSSTVAEVGLPLGSHAWIHAGFGKSEAESEGPRDDEDLDADAMSVGLGVGGRRFEFSTNYVQRKDGAFKQDDWAFAFDWRGERGGLGADAFVRSAEAETTTSVRARRLQPRTIRIVESLDATGFGVHGDVDVGENLNLFAAAMTYDYDDVSSNHPYLSRLLFLNGSGVTRDQAFLEKFFGVGATYRFSSVSLTAQYLRDEALETGDITNTGELAVLILLGDHWSLTPSIGYSASDLDGGIAYGGLVVGYHWN
jgi:hypothetical protein